MDLYLLVGIYLSIITYELLAGWSVTHVEKSQARAVSALKVQLSYQEYHILLIYTVLLSHYNNSYNITHLSPQDLNNCLIVAMLQQPLVYRLWQA